MHINKKRIKDSQFRVAKVERHPELEPYMIAHTGGGKGYFRSTYNESKLARQLHLQAPDLYYWPEKPENLKLELPIGGYLVLPHSLYVHETECQYKFMMEKDL